MSKRPISGAGHGCNFRAAKTCFLELPFLFHFLQAVKPTIPIPTATSQHSVPWGPLQFLPSNASPWKGTDISHHLFIHCFSNTCSRCFSYILMTSAQCCFPSSVGKRQRSNKQINNIIEQSDKHDEGWHDIVEWLGDLRGLCWRAEMGLICENQPHPNIWGQGWRQSSLGK